MARAMVRDVNDADDLEQGLWLDVLQRPPRDRRSLRGWLFTAVRRDRTNASNSERSRARREQAVARPESAPSPHEAIARAEALKQVVVAVMDLAEPYRSAVVLRYFEEQTPGAIAARLGVPVETVRTRLKRALAQLRERFDAEHEGGREQWRAALLPLVGGPVGTPTAGTPADAAPSAAASALTGATMMATKKAVVLAAALLLLLLLGTGVGTWFATRSGDPAGPVSDRTPQPPTERTHRARAVPTPTGDTAATPADPAISESPESPRDRPLVAVVDVTTNQPITTAMLAVSRPDGRTAFHNYPAADGRFALDPALVGGTATIWAWAPGYARRRLADTELAADVRTIALAPCEPLEVRFVTDSGRTLTAEEVHARFGRRLPMDAFELVADDAIAGNDVPRMLRLLFGPSADWHTTLFMQDDGSSLRLSEGVGTGRWRLFVRRPDATPWLSEPFVVGDARAATVITVRLPDAPRTRRIRLVTGDTRTPLAGASLVPWLEVGDGRAYLPGAPIETDALGVAALPYDPSEQRGATRAPIWWVHAPGYVGMLPASALDDPDATESVDIALPRSTRVEGVAYLRSGEPAAGCRVVTATKGMTFGCVTGPTGTFKMKDVPAPNGAVDLMLLVGDAFTQAHATVGEDGVARVVIGAPAASGTRGRITGVVTSGGVGLAGLFVVDQPTNAKGGFVRTDGDGRFALDGLDVGTAHHLVIYCGDPQADDSFHRIRTSTARHLDPGKPLEFTFDLPAGAVRVRVVDADTGEPIAGARVVAGPLDAATQPDRFPGFDYRPGWAGFTGADGTLLLRALVASSSHKVTASADAYEAGERDGVVPGTLTSPAELELRLKRR